MNTQSSILPKSYNCSTLEGNWYEDRCTSNFDSEKKKNFSLKSPNSWQYNSTYDQIGNFNKQYPSINEKFANASDNYINFQNKDNEMYVSMYKKSYHPSHRDDLTFIKHNKGYYENKQNELESYRNNWTKKNHSFRTTYKDDLLKTFMTK